MARFISYSQEFEDIIIYVVLKDYVKKGMYIDVGANDPIKFSVTKLFYDIGWSGINIEPLDDMCELLAAERPRDINLCMGAGAKVDVMKLAVAQMGSTFALDIQNKMGEKLFYIEKPILPLSLIYDRYCTNKEVHFCKIDVEGFEKEVLQGIDFQKMRPWLFIIEAAEPGTDIPSYEKWEYILLDNDYEFAFDMGINRYYVAKEKRFLKDKFEKIGKFLKENECYIMNMIRVN